MPFKHYIRKKTLEEAKNWMRISNLNITQICIKFGFCSPAYFTLCFKKAFGMTPREYMQQVKAEKESLCRRQKKADRLRKTILIKTKGRNNSDA